MVTHSVKAASRANRVLFIKDGEVFHQIYRGDSTNEQLYQKISDTLTILATGGEGRSDCDFIQKTGTDGELRKHKKPMLPYILMASEAW